MKTLHISTIIAIGLMTFLLMHYSSGELQPKTLSQLYQEHKLILTGKVFSITDKPSENLTAYDIQIITFLKSPATYSVITVFVPDQANENVTTHFNIGDKVQLYLDSGPKGYIVSPYSFKIEGKCDSFGPDYQSLSYVGGGVAFSPIRLYDLNGSVLENGPFVNQEFQIGYDDFPLLPLNKTSLEISVKLEGNPNPLFHGIRQFNAPPCTEQNAMWNFVAHQIGNYIIETKRLGGIYDNKILVENDLANYSFSFSVKENPPATSVHIFLSPLKQIKSGISANNVICKEGFQLIIKTEDGSPACVKQDTVKKLVERGWAGPVETTSTNESNVLSSINQTMVIGNDTYDTTEFQPMTGNAVHLDSVKFTYQGNSPVNNSCYPDFINQTEARDFEILAGNISDMSAHQCWPPSNYPQNMTKGYVSPPDLFSRYSISFFDINQTTGVGWCHSKSCDLGKMFYLVKRGWDAPITYDTVSLLEFHLATNASTISAGQPIGIDMSTSNKLSRSILIPHEYNYSFNGTGLGPCTYGPFRLAIFEGYFGENNFTQGNELSLYQPGIYSCPTPEPAKGYKFEPMNNNATIRCDPFSYCGNTEQVQFHISFSGFWNDVHFHKFQSGLYTIIAGDEWGNHAIRHFVVTNSTTD